MSLNMNNMELTIKNTFLDIVDDSAPRPVKRCSSVPRSFKPSETMACMAIIAIASDASTADSDECSTDHEGSGGCSSYDSDCACSECHGEETSEITPPAAKGSSPRTVLSLSEELAPTASPKTVLSLSSTITATSLTKLNSKAPLFEPKLLPEDMKLVMTAARASLSASPKVMAVQMSEGALGAPTVIEGTFPKGSLGKADVQKTLSIVRMALLDAAANSEQTYVIGYQAQPFQDLGTSGFSVKLGTVTETQADVMCWDTIQTGCCPRGPSCRWCHLTETELTQVIVTLNEV